MFGNLIFIDLQSYNKIKNNLLIMKKTIILIALAINAISTAQSWNLNGNSGTVPGTNYIGTSDNQDLVLKTNNQERLRVNSSGNIGLAGAPANDIALKVSGRTQVLTNILSDTFYVGNEGANHDNGNSLVFLRYTQYQPNNPGIIDVAGWGTSAAYGWIMSLRANGKLFLGTNPNNSCTDCNDYRLFVKDGIRTEKVKVDIASSNGWADYVFDDSYKLMDLNSLENYIKTNKHLPEVPSTDEAIKNGIELKEMNILLLKKVEELTLYVIQQQKEIQKLKNTVKNDEK